jgi:hypothetical protein
MFAVSAAISDLNSAPPTISAFINHGVFRHTADVSFLDISELKIFAMQNPSLIRVKKNVTYAIRGRGNKGRCRGEQVKKERIRR